MRLTSRYGILTWGLLEEGVNAAIATLKIAHPVRISTEDIAESFPGCPTQADYEWDASEGEHSIRINVSTKYADVEGYIWHELRHAQQFERGAIVTQRADDYSWDDYQSDPSELEAAETEKMADGTMTYATLNLIAFREWLFDPWVEA